MKKLIYVSLLAMVSASCNVNNADNPTNNTNSKDTDSLSGADMPRPGDSGIYVADTSGTAVLAADTTAY